MILITIAPIIIVTLMIMLMMAMMTKFTMIITTMIIKSFRKKQQEIPQNVKKGNLNEEGNYRKTEGNKIHAETRDCSEHNNIEPGTFIKLSRHVRNKCRQ